MAELFGTTQRSVELQAKLRTFMDEHIYPREPLHYQHMTSSEPHRWTVPTWIPELQAKAKAQGLWNLFLPIETDGGRYGASLSNLEYAPLAEIMGRVPWAPDIFNCGAPDTGNMEVLARYGSEQQKTEWLLPLLNGDIRSCFAMTEPNVASSDATNMEATITREGDSYVCNGRKWWTSGAMDPRCAFAIFMGRSTDQNAAAHQQHSMIIIPMKAEGVKIERALTVFGFDDAPHGHAEVTFTNVRVPLRNMILGEGRGFEIAQGRLGPGRIHHCMRLVGIAERALELMKERALSRVAFGRPLARLGPVLDSIALSRCEIDQARLLTLKAAYAMDTVGPKGARDLIAMIKVVAPTMAETVISRAIQVHGGAGVSQDFPLAMFYITARTLRLADGPDEVHRVTVARMELGRTQRVLSEKAATAGTQATRAKL